MEDTRTAAFWQRFLAKTGRDSSTKYAESFSFEMSEYWANELLRLVLAGQKRATSSSLRAYESEGAAPPKIGDLSIVTDWAGNPRCVIETTGVTIMKFSDMTFEVCRREGEDECLDTWREGHIRFFTREGEAMGYAFSEDMPIVFEDFAVIYREDPS